MSITYQIYHSGWYNYSPARSILIARLYFSQDPGVINVSVKQKLSTESSCSHPGKVEKEINNVFRTVFFHVTGHDPLKSLSPVTAKFMFSVQDSNGDPIALDPNTLSIPPIDPDDTIKPIEIDPCEFQTP